MASTSLFTALGLVSVLIWGTAVGMAGSLGASVGALTASGLVYLTAGSLGVLYFLTRGELRVLFGRLDASACVQCFIFFALNVALFWIGMGMAQDGVQVAELGVVNYLWPTLTLLLSIPIAGRRPTPLFALGVLIAAVGVLVPLVEVRGVSLSGMSERFVTRPDPYLVILTCAVAWGVYSNLTRRYSSGVNALAIMLFLVILGAGLLTAGLLSDEPRNFNSTTIRELVFLGVADALAYAFWDLGMRRGDQVTVASFSYATPVLSTLFTTLYLGIWPGGGVWIGCLLVVIGAAICRKTLR